MARRYRRFACMALFTCLLGPTLAAAATPHILYKATDWVPDGGVIFAKSQAMLFGTARSSGHTLSGAVFKFNLTTATYGTLHSFATQAAYAPSGLILGPNGLLYGLVAGGPAGYSGAIFRMHPKSGIASILYRFPAGSGGQALDPEALAVDPNGIVYGLTYYGGTGNVGTVFKYDPASSTYTTLHEFSTTNDCFAPYGALIFDAGFTTLYGTTASNSGASNNGSGCVFSINPQTGAEAVLATSGTQGITATPNGLLFGSNGQLYVAAYGRQYGQIFSLDPTSGAVTLIDRFLGGADGAQPTGALAFGPDGLLYGTTMQGGKHKSAGTAYTLNVTTGVKTTLASFNADTNITTPLGSIAVGKAGRMFGAGADAIYAIRN
jgi:uncharacterized repeat protein (TIGR03803 family)